MTEKENAISIEETNALRAKLGLKPLNVTVKSSSKVEVKLSLEGNPQMSKQNLLVEARISKSKERRKLKRKLNATIAYDDNMDTSSWLQSFDSRSKVAQASIKPKRAPTKSSKNELKGVKIAHKLEDFQKNEEVIMTLKDQDVLDNSVDELENVSMKEQDVRAQNKELRDLIKRDKVVHGGMEERDAILQKYDEEDRIRNQKSGLVFDSNGQVKVDRDAAVEQILNETKTTLNDPKYDIVIRPKKRGRKRRNDKIFKGAVYGELKNVNVAMTHTVQQEETEFENQLLESMQHRARVQREYVKTVKSETTAINLPSYLKEGVPYTPSVGLTKTTKKAPKTIRQQIPDTPDLREIMQAAKSSGLSSALSALTETGHLAKETQADSKQKFNLDLEHRTKEGRILTPKEAYKLMSHKFHGIAPGKIKQEKLRKKHMAQDMIKNMAHLDTPLNTVSALKSKQKRTKQAYVKL